MRLDSTIVLCLVPIVGIALVAPRFAAAWMEHRQAASAEAMTTTPSPPAGGGVARIRDRGDGHFQVEARIGARRIPFMIDTGATLVALRWETARDLGLVSPSDPMTVEISTANGSLKAKRITLDRLDVDGVEVDGVDALVLPQGALGTNLLGMSFLSRLSHFEIARGTLVLQR